MPRPVKAPTGPIQCNDYVRHILTGYEGTVIARTEWINGCVRVEVQAHKLDKDGEPVKHHGFDVQEIERVTRPRTARAIPIQRIKLSDHEGGGPRDASPRRSISGRDYRD